MKFHKLPEGLGLISHGFRVGRKEKLKFGQSQATSRLREVSNEVRNLGERVQRSEPLNPCYNLPLGTRNSLQGSFHEVKNSEELILFPVTFI